MYEQIFIFFISEYEVNERKQTYLSVRDLHIVFRNMKLCIHVHLLHTIYFIFRKYLTDTDVKVRSKCVSLIGEVIHQLPNSQLTEEEGWYSFTSNYCVF